MKNKKPPKKLPPLKGTKIKYSKISPDKNQVKLLNILGTGVNYDDRVINNREHLKWVIGVLKREGKKIVYTGGVYDMLHEGHVKYLEKAKSYGDILVVGVDSDELTRSRKPDIKNRPVVLLKERLLMLAHVRTVNILTVLDVNEHQDQLIVDILPDVAVFSTSSTDVVKKEKTLRKAIGAYCGKIVFLKPQATTSTTARMRLLMMDGADGLGKNIKKTIDDFFNPKGGEQ